MKVGDVATHQNNCEDQDMRSPADNSKGYEGLDIHEFKRLFQTIGV